jgi:hypothetical protein
VAAYIMCRPAPVIDQSGGGLHRHPIVLVWRPATAIQAEIDRTNERPDMRGFTRVRCNADAIALDHRIC